MMIYLIIFILLAVFSWFEIKHIFTNKQWIYAQNFLIILLFLIAGLRYETGVDWAGYQYYYDKIAPFDEAFNSDNFKGVFLTLDLGYALFNSIVKMFGGGIQVIFFIVSAVSFRLLLLNLRFYTKYVITGLLVYYCFYFFVLDMSGLRQGIAVQLVLYALQYLLNGKSKKNFIWYVVLAGSIHWSAFILLLLYFLPKYKTIKYSSIIIFSCLFLFIFNIKIVELLIPNIQMLLKWNTLLIGKLDAYTSHKTFSKAREIDPLTLFAIVRILIIYGLFVLYKSKLESFKYINFVFNLFLLEIICYFGLYELNEISERLRYYFMFSEIILLSMIFSVLRHYFFKDMMYLFVVFIAMFNSAPFILEFPSTVAYHPYQNYIIYKVLNKKSTGEQRLQQHIDTH